METPLSSISTIITNLRLRNTLGTVDSETINSSSIKMEEHISFMVDTMNEFSNFFSPDKEKRVEDLSRPISIVVSLIKNELDKNSIELKQNINLPTKVETLSNELIQVILNIVNNAKEQFEKDQEDKFIKIVGHEDDEFSYISIKDNAGGIPNELIDRVFDKYFTTKKR
jgi:nitrogen fixation/metabolism regulation signal transduction histidine kinase